MFLGSNKNENRKRVSSKLRNSEELMTMIVGSSKRRGDVRMLRGKNGNRSGLFGRRRSGRWKKKKMVGKAAADGCAIAALATGGHGTTVCA